MKWKREEKRGRRWNREGKNEGQRERKWWWGVVSETTRRRKGGEQGVGLQQYTFISNVTGCMCVMGASVRCTRSERVIRCKTRVCVHSAARPT